MKITQDSDISHKNDLTTVVKTTMTYEEAKKVIDPKTTTEAYVECYMQFGTVMSAEIWKAKVDEACEIAAEALEKQIPKKPIKYKGEIVCLSCKTLVGSSPYCRYCGQALDWGGEE